MFLTYLERELRRRSKQALVIAVGLGIGIGLVVTVSSASAGVKDAQTKVLHSLYGVGTDATVTQAPSASGFGPQQFGFGGPRPTPGGSFSSTHIRRVPDLVPLRQSRVSQIARLDDVNAATGSLSLTETSVSGTLPDFASGGAPVGAQASGGSGGFHVNVSSTSLVGVEPSSTGVGPLSPGNITKGHYFTTPDQNAHVAIVTTSYASQHNLKVGSTLSLNGTAFQIIGLASIPSSTTDVYLPLNQAQSLAGMSKQVTTIYVSVNSAANVAHVQSEIQKLLPKATVTTTANLAKEVTGSLASATQLVTDLGKWLAVTVLLVAFLIAALFMLTTVSRRVREFGTLKAIGWRTRRIVEQVVGEGLVQGLAGAVLGAILGIVGTEAVSAFAPTLTATVGPSFATSGASAFRTAGGFGGGFANRFANGASRPAGFAARFNNLSHTVLVHLGTSLQGGTLGIAIGLALLGGLLAGAVGSWRAARMRPAEALRQVG